MESPDSSAGRTHDDAAPIFDPPRFMCCSCAPGANLCRAKTTAFRGASGARNRDAALAFINFALSAHAQAAFSSTAFYGPTNRLATPPPELFARMTSAPDNLRRVLPVDWRFISSVREQWVARWRREIISASGP
jgi:ABC-type thiamine transport system substrate-binding protein